MVLSHQIFAGIYPPDDRKQQKTLHRLKDKACSHGDDFAVRRLDVKKDGALGGKPPVFRRFPDALGCETFEKAGKSSARAVERRRNITIRHDVLRGRREESAEYANHSRSRHGKERSEAIHAASWIASLRS
jgi:hypothetical protein